MNKIKKITKPEDMCIGQLYMYLNHNRLERGFCIKIEEKSVTFKKKESCYDDTIYFIEFSYPKTEYNYIAEYNARIYNKYQELKRQHEKECEDCLNGKTLYKKIKPKEKWYNKIFKKKK